MVAATIAVVSVGSVVGVEAVEIVALAEEVAVGALAVNVAKTRCDTVASTAAMSGVGSARPQPASTIPTTINKMTKSVISRAIMHQAFAP